MSELINISISVIAFIGVFFAGWLTATDKIRAELYKRKLDAYESIFDHLQGIATATIAFKYTNLDEGVIFSQRIALFQQRMKNILYLSENVEKAITRFDITGLEAEEIYQKIDEIAKYAADDLQLKRHNFMTNIAAGELKTLQLLYRTKGKNPTPI